MSNYLFYPVLELKGYIILSLVVLFALMVIMMTFFGKKKNGLKDFKEQSLFLFLSKKDVLYLTLGISEWLLVVSIILTQSSVGLVQLVALGVHIVAKILVAPVFTLIFSELICGGLSTFALVIGNLLLDYMAETGFDFYIFVIWALLSLFAIAYGAYHIVYSTGRMAQAHENRKAKE